MPITKSAKKALRQSIKKRKHNLSYIVKFKKLRTQIKNFISQKNPAEAKNLLPNLYKILDKGAKKKVWKKNTATRYKSRLSKLINKS